MEAIVLAFTLKGQKFEDIANAIKLIGSKTGNNNILIHGFMPRKEVEERKFDTSVLDFLEDFFPIRLNMYFGTPLRDDMADVATKLKATVYAIGEIKDGVKEEVDLYRAAGLTIVEISLPK